MFCVETVGNSMDTRKRYYNRCTYLKSNYKAGSWTSMQAHGGDEETGCRISSKYF